MCIVTLTLEIQPLLKVIAQPWVMDKNGVKYDTDLTLQQGVMTQLYIYFMLSVNLTLKK